MDILNTILPSLPLLMVSVWIEFRLVFYTLGGRWSKPLTYCIMLLTMFVAGSINLTYHLAGTIDANSIYYSLITFLLYVILLKGSLVKKLFFTVLIHYGIPIIYYVFLPFVQYWFQHDLEAFLLGLKILEYMNIVFFIMFVEYVRKKFLNLHQELPLFYTVYLTTIIVFVQIAVYSRYDGTLVRYDGVLPFFQACTSAAFAAVAILIVLVAIFAVDQQVELSLRQQLHAMEAENLKNRELERQRLSAFRHDLKNHLLCLSRLIESNKPVQAASYMQTLTDTVKLLDSPVETGNDYADALLQVKYHQAMDADIQITLDMAIPAQGYLEPVDLCCILSNAFDNAIAACQKLSKEKRWIKARAFIKQGQFVLTVKNSKSAYVTVTDNEVFPREITSHQGIGLSNVKTVIKKYNGTLHLSADDDFCFRVLIPPCRL